MIIDFNDEVYSFSEVMDRIDLTKYLVNKDSKMGRPRYDSVKLLKIMGLARFLWEKGFSDENG